MILFKRNAEIFSNINYAFNFIQITAHKKYLILIK